METLTMAPEHKQGVLGKKGQGGEKKVTIRDRKRYQFKSGEKIKIVSSDKTWGCVATLASVGFYTYATVPAKDYQADGFNSLAEMLEGMKSYYPHIERDSECTVIHWYNVTEVWGL